jgi:hypothetical protein
VVVVRINITQGYCKKQEKTHNTNKLWHYILKQKLAFNKINGLRRKTSRKTMVYDVCLQTWANVQFEVPGIIVCVIRAKRLRPDSLLARMEREASAAKRMLVNTPRTALVRGHAPCLWSQGFPCSRLFCYS